MAEKRDKAERIDNRKKIIYVDDINFNLVMVRNYLKEQYLVYPAQSVAIMYEILKNITPDLILLDVQMPDINGYDAITALKKDANYADIPVVFITSQDGNDYRIKSLNLGADAHLIKPFTTELLLETVDEIFNPSKNKTVKEPADLYDIDEIIESGMKPAILAVDDVPSILKAIHYALRDNYKVYTLSDPEELQGYLRKVKPDLFLLDYMMPGISGFELVPIIRSFKEHKETPIIFLTSAGTVNTVSEAVRYGACDFIVKPFDAAILCGKIKKHLR